MKTFKVIKPVVLGFIDPIEDEQYDGLLKVGDRIGLDEHALYLFLEDGPPHKSITERRAVEVWAREGLIEAERDV